MKKIVVIIGGAGEIGSYLARQLKKKNFTIVIIDKSKPNHNDYDKLFLFDLLLFNKYKSLEKKIRQSFSTVDILINCAAMVGTSKDKGWNTNFENQSLKSWKKCIDINLTSTFLIIKTLLPFLKKSINPKIINISSIYGFTAPRFDIYKNTKIHNQIAYSVSKAGVIQLTKWLSSYLEKKFSVNSISLGGLENNSMNKNLK